MKRKRTNKNKKVFYIQDWGTYSNQSIVTVGMSYEEMLTTMKRKKLNKSIVKAFEKDEQGVKQSMAGANGFCWSDQITGGTVIAFEDWENNWQHWDCLLHEIVHAIHAILDRNKNMASEDEGRAYQTEYLFREIRRHLWKKTS